MIIVSILCEGVVGKDSERDNLRRKMLSVVQVHSSIFTVATSVHTLSADTNSVTLSSLTALAKLQIALGTW